MIKTDQVEQDDNDYDEQTLRANAGVAATDYANEAELAPDESKQLAEKAHAAFGQTTTTTSLLDDSDDDDDYDAEPAAAGSVPLAAATPLPSQSAATVSLRQNLAHEHLLTENLQKEIENYTTSHSVHDGTGMIRFTDLFAAPACGWQPGKDLLPRNKRHFPLRAARNVAERDEEADYHTKERLNYLEGYESKGHDLDLDMMILNDSVAELPTGPSEVGQYIAEKINEQLRTEAERRRAEPNGNFLSNVEQESWEDKIQWKGCDRIETEEEKAKKEKEDEQKSLSTKFLESVGDSRKSIILHPGNSTLPRFEYKAVKAVASNEAEAASDSLYETQTVKAARYLYEDADNIVRKPMKRVVSEESGNLDRDVVVMLDRLREQVGAINTDLNDPDSWVDGIVWDDATATKRHVPLVWDRNDKRMNFTAPTRKISATEIAAVNSNTAFGWMNMSADAAYKQAKTETAAKESKLSGGMRVRNSFFATKLKDVAVDLDAEYVEENWHRPELQPTGKKSIKFKKGKMDKRKEEVGNGQNHIQTRERLTLQSSDFLMCEYFEQHPILLSNLGMGARLLHYRAKTKTEVAGNLDIKAPKLNEGEFIAYDPEVPLPSGPSTPLLPVFKAGTTQSVFKTNMSRAPAFEHKASATDFIIIRHGKRKATIREIPRIYTIGTVEALEPIHAPNARPTKMHTRKRIEVFIKRLLTRPVPKDMIATCTTADVTDYFGKSTNIENTARQELQRCADFTRGGDTSGFWTTKDGYVMEKEDELRKMVQPEKQCAFESMRSGHMRLIDHGVHSLHNPFPVNTISIPAVVNQLSQDEHTMLHAERIISLLSGMPWYLAKAQMEAIAGTGQKPLAEYRDAQIRMCTPWGYLDSKGGKKSRSLPRPGVSIGEDKSLQGYSMGQLFHKLVQVGVKDDEVRGLTRWDRICLLRRIFTATAQGNSGQGLKRGKTSKIAISALVDMQSNELKKAWEHQQSKLTDHSQPEFSSDEDEDDEDDDMDDFAASMEALVDDNTKKKKKKNHEIDAEDQEEMQRFMEEGDDDVGSKEKSDKNEPPPPPKKGGLLKKNPETGQKQRIVIRKRLLVKNPDGTQSMKWEYITDSKKIKEVLDKHDKEGNSGPKGRRGDGDVGTRRLSGDGRKRVRHGVRGEGSQIRVGISLLEREKRRQQQGGVPGERKRKRKSDEDNEYVAPTAANRSRRLMNNPEIVLGQFLTKVAEAMYNCPDADIYFNSPVTKKIAPDYNEKIEAAGSTPIDLGTVRQKARDAKYKTAEEMREDIDRMVKNSEIYNGPAAAVTILAKKVRDAGLAVWRKHADDIEKVNNEIIARQ